VQALPATGFVKTHKERHNIKESKVNDSFLVVERPAGDSTIKLDENLSSMFQKSFLEWSDEVVVADKYKERADRARAQRAGISVL